MAHSILLLLAALVMLTRGTPAGAAVPEPPPADPSCTLYQVSIADDCAYETRNPVVTTPGTPITLQQAGGLQYGTALGCGTDACVYWGNVFSFFNTLGPQWATGVSTAGTCTSYPGLVSAGTPTRDVPAPPGVCVVRYDPVTLRAPSKWALVNSFVSEGIFPRLATSHLITVSSEWFQLSTVWVDPIGNKKPNAAYAVRPGADPTHAQCLMQLTVASWLPNRVIPDCIRLGEAGLSNYVPNGDWDVVAVHDINPPGKIRSVPTPWTVGHATVNEASTTAEVRRIPNLDLAMSVELLGGDAVIGVNETDTARVTLTTSTAGVVGEIYAMGFSTGTKVVQVQRDSNGGYAEVSTPTPVPPTNGFSMFPGDVVTFDVPIRGAATGPIRLFVRGGGVTRWFGEDRIASVTLPVEVTLDAPPPVRPITVCGFDVFTYVASPSTFSTLAVESAAGIEVGTELVVDPCTPDAEEVTVQAIAGTSLTVTPSMQKVHATNTPIIRRPSTISTTTTLAGSTTSTTTTPAGAATTSTTTTLTDAATTSTTTSSTTTTLPPCTSARCRVDDALAAACGAETVPANLAGKIDKAIAALDAAPNQTGKQAKRTRAKARKLLKGASALAKRGARGKKPKVTADCADALRAVLGSLAASVPR